MATDSGAYEAACRAWALRQVPLWLEVRVVLKDRPKWRFEINNGSPGWHFGLEGVSRLVISVDNSGVGVYIHDVDRVRHLGTVAELRWWLEVHEADYEGFTPLQTAILGTLLPRQLEQWKAAQDSRQDGPSETP